MTRVFQHQGFALKQALRRVPWPKMPGHMGTSPETHTGQALGGSVRRDFG